MDYVLALHSHLPWVLHHGKWPHGSDWLTEAAVDTYLPLIGTLRGLRQDGIASPVTIGFTPVLANQLAHPSFHADLEAFAKSRAFDLRGSVRVGGGRVKTDTVRFRGFDDVARVEFPDAGAAQHFAQRAERLVNEHQSQCVHRVEVPVERGGHDAGLAGHLAQAQ